MLKNGCLAVVVLAIGLPVVASQFLPWWGTLIFVLVEGVVLVKGIPKLLGAAVGGVAKRLFETKSVVLRDATVTLHDVREVSRPAGAAADREVENDEEDWDDEEDGPEAARYIEIDCTVIPAPPIGPMQHWDPFELQLCPFDKPTAFNADDDGDENDEASVHDVHALDDDGHAVEIDGKLTGSHRLRLVFACPATLQGRAKLRYYFESLGDIALP